MERGTILDKAKETINVARQDAYGNPEDSFSAIAELWTAYTGVTFTAHDAAMMMALLKVARIKGGAGSEDSYVDLCGYAALAADMWRQEKGE